MMASMGFDRSDRMARVAAEAERDGVGAVVVAPGPDLVYLAGYDPPPLERLTALVLRPGADPVLVVPELERPRAEVSPAGPIVELATWSDGDDPYRAVRRLLASGRVAVSDRMWAAHLIGLQRALPGSDFEPASGLLSRLRARKDAAEIELLGRAARGADEAFSRIAREPMEGRTEEEVARALAGHLLDAGHESVAFTIVASGPNGASPHHEPGTRGVRAGDAVVMDFGGRIGGYCSDITRTVVVREPAGEIGEVHEVVRQAQEAAFAAAGPGVPAQEVDRAARAVIEDAGYGAFFVHRTGHGIGLEEHEAPYVVEGNAAPLEVGNCFSIEPGIYLEGRFGVRIEDIVAVSPDGVVRLNHAPRQLVAVA
jgi:Xaa-Pro aminopeptidase